MTELQDSTNKNKLIMPEDYADMFKENLLGEYFNWVDVVRQRIISKFPNMEFFDGGDNFNAKEHSAITISYAGSIYPENSDDLFLNPITMKFSDAISADIGKTKGASKVITYATFPSQDYENLSCDGVSIGVGIDEGGRNRVDLAFSIV